MATGLVPPATVRACRWCLSVVHLGKRREAGRPHHSGMSRSTVGSSRRSPVGSAPCAVRHYFDLAEPFGPDSPFQRCSAGRVRHRRSDRHLDLGIPGGGRAAAIVEYALWTDWDIQHLYELEHACGVLDAEGELVHAEGSWHGEPVPLLQDVAFRVPVRGRAARGLRPARQARAVGRAAPVLGPRGLSRASSAGRRRIAPAAGSMAARYWGAIGASTRRDGLTRAYLHTRAFSCRRSGSADAGTGRTRCWSRSRS